MIKSVRSTLPQVKKSKTFYITVKRYKAVRRVGSTLEDWITYGNQKNCSYCLCVFSHLELQNKQCGGIRFPHFLQPANLYCFAFWYMCMMALTVSIRIAHIPTPAKKLSMDNCMKLYSLIIINNIVVSDSAWGSVSI